MMRRKFLTFAILGGLFGALHPAAGWAADKPLPPSSPWAPGQALAAGPDSKFLHLRLWVIFTTPKPDFKGGPPDLPAQHMRHQVELEKKGIMFAAGPVSDASGMPVFGMIVIRAASFDEANRIAMSDPMHAVGARTYVLRQWDISEGTFNVQLNFSDGTYSFK